MRMNGVPQGFTGLLLLGVLLCPREGHGAALNLGDVNCARYENEILPSTLPGFKADPIDTVMWLFGFSVAKSGERVMYGDSLTAFGFALDAMCKNRPAATLLEAVIATRSKRENPMDLTRLDCTTFETRHVALRKSDPESATTLTMWLFGYAVATAGSQTLDVDAVGRFDASMNAWCANHPYDSVFDALSAPNEAIPNRPPRPGAHRRAVPPATAPEPAAPGPR
jgi:hypothetical protein